MILGLTGGIASGKTTASNEFKKLGAIIIDADKISKEVANSQEVIEKVKRKIGERVIRTKIIKGSLDIEKEIEELDREKLKEEIFKDKNKREVLNNIMHPLIIKEIEGKMNLFKSAKLIILDIPLLYETKLEYLCEKVLVVWVAKEEQLKRISKRDGLSKELGRKIIDSQMELKEKLKRSNYSIENAGTLEELKEKIKEIYREIV